jgi:hypothetical protein
LQFLGEEAAFSIGGFQDLKSIIKLHNGNLDSLCTLIKSIPASTGMTRPQLFQHVEPNISGIITMVTFQKQDSNLVYAHQKTLQSKIQQVIVDGEEDNIFVDNYDGIWFGGINKTKTGRILATQQTDKSSLEYTKLINRVLHSPPKKCGGGIPPTLIFAAKPTQASPPIPILNPPTQTQWNTKPNHSIEDKYASIQLQFAQKYEHNVNFNNRISSLDYCHSD